MHFKAAAVHILGCGQKHLIFGDTQHRQVVELDRGWIWLDADAPVIAARGRIFASGLEHVQSTMD